MNELWNKNLKEVLHKPEMKSIASVWEPRQIELEAVNMRIERWQLMRTMQKLPPRLIGVKQRQHDSLEWLAMSVDFECMGLYANSLHNVPIQTTREISKPVSEQARPTREWIYNEQSAAELFKVVHGDLAVLLQPSRKVALSKGHHQQHVRST